MCGYVFSGGGVELWGCERLDLFFVAICFVYYEKMKGRIFTANKLGNLLFVDVF